MKLEKGTPVVDVTNGSERFRFERYFRQGRSFDLLLAQDIENSGQPALLRGLRYADIHSARAIEERRILSGIETEALSAPHPALPFPLAVVQLDNPAISDLHPGLKNNEPLVACRFIEGRTLDAWLQRTHPGGAPPEVALDLTHQLLTALDALHEHGFIHRAVAPEHILIEPSGTLRLIGIGNAARREERVNPSKEFAVPPWTAPEIQRELSGRFVTPRADLYSVGAILGFLLTGQAPSERLETPWTRSAIEKLQALDPGLTLIIAHCMQPLHKKRFAQARRLLPFVAPDALPDRRTREFAEIALVSPWIDAEPETAAVGSLSPGPLVNRPAASPRAAAPPATEQPATQIASSAGAATRVLAAVPDESRSERTGPRPLTLVMALGTGILLIVVLISFLRQTPTG
jgi:serine/threonine protein kinase